MNKSKKNVIIMAVLSVTILGMVLSIVINNKVADSNDSVLGTQDSKAVKIAICPTYQYLIEAISNYGYEVVKTNSTAESISLLRNGDVAIVLSGRKPLANESDLVYKIVSLPNRYSFLSKDSKTVSSEELSSMTVYTDQDTETIRTLFNIDKVENVENVYTFLDKGIVITSWENSDYTKASVIHVIQSDGMRHQNSRIPVIYSRNEKIVEDLHSLLNKLNKEKVFK